MKRKRQIPLLFALCFAFLLAMSSGANAVTGNDFSKLVSYTDDTICITTQKDLGIKEGEAFIPTGETVAPNDIIIFNDKIAIAIGTDTRDPWGYPAGSVLDAARLTTETEKPTLKEAYLTGEVQCDYDRIWDIQFLMNNWDSWAPGNAGKVTYEVVRFDFNTNTEYTLSSGKGLPTLKLAKKYTVKGNFDVVTYYSMEAHSDTAYMTTYVKNNSDETVKALKCGYSLTHEGDFNDCTYSAGAGDVSDMPYHHFTTAYTENTAVTVAVPDQVTNIGTDTTSGYQDLYCTTDFAPGHEKYFNGRIIIDDHGDLARVSDFFMKEYNVAAAEKVTINGRADVARPVIVIKRSYANGKTKTFSWVQGNEDGSYSITVPALKEGESYIVFAEKKNYAATDKLKITKDDFEDQVCTLKNLSPEKKIPVTFRLTDSKGNPIYGKVQIPSEYPNVRYTGEGVFLTETKGVVETMISPGDYNAIVYGEGYNFYSKPIEFSGNTGKTTVDIGIHTKFSLKNSDWLSADVHHHSNKNDGYSSANLVIRSQMAAGLSVGVISDHDFTSENKTAYNYILDQDLDMSFYPSVEISCSWAHFNVLPQNEKAYKLLLDGIARFDQFADYNDIVDSVHDLGKSESDGDDYIGATITQNHPYITYGLAYADKYSIVPGKLDKDGNVKEDFDYDAYDTVEFNGAMWGYGSAYDDYYNTPVFTDVMNDWTKALTGDIKIHNIVAGSDAHDVLANYTTFHSGVNRTIAFVENSRNNDRIENGLAFTKAANEGHSYITSGPLLFPDKMFGDTFETEDSFTFSIDIQSINGIKKIELYTDSKANAKGNCFKLADSVELDGKIQEYTYRYTAVPEKDGDHWYAIKVIAGDGKYAISNPYWVKTLKKQAPTGLPYFMDANNNKVFLGFALDAENYINETAQDLLFTENTKSFNDIDNHWALNSIHFVAERELFIGTDKDRFAPDTRMNRAMFITVLGRLYERSYGMNPGETTLEFEDVEADSWYTPYVRWATEAGIVKGYSATEFRPYETITREQMACFLHRFSDYIKFGQKATGEVTFADKDTIRDWAQESVLFCQENKLMNGIPENCFAPQNHATRAEAAATIERLITLFLTENK